MYSFMKAGDKLHFISDKEENMTSFEVDLQIEKELYRNGRKQGLLAVCKKT